MNEQFIIKQPNMQETCWTCLKTGDDVDIMSFDEVMWHQKQISASKYEQKIHDMNKRHICVICRHILKKCLNFPELCRRSFETLMEMADSDNNIMDKNTKFYSIYNFQTNITSTGLCINPEECGLNVKIENNYYEHNENNGLENNSNNGFDSNDPELQDNDNGTLNNDLELQDNYIALDIDNFDLSDEDVPLKMLSKNQGVKSRKKRQKSMRTKPLLKATSKQMKKEQDTSLENSNNDNRKQKKNMINGFSSRMVQETDEYIVIKLTKEQVLEEMQAKSISEQYTRSLYKCERCVKGFNFEEVLTGHMQKHSQENGAFKCDICEQYCPSAVSLRGHMKSHTTRYECKICSTVKLSRQHLLEHFGLAHTDAASMYSCEHCHFQTNKRTVIQRHVRIHRDGNKLACHQCGRLFNNQASLRVHTTRHDKSKSLQCSQCPRRFLYPSLLHKHVWAVHERSDYYCVECDVRFKSPDNLRLHFKKAKRHRDPSSYTHECPECGLKFISAPTLAVHLTTTHGQPKQHACHLCPRLYSNKESLQGHVRRRHNNQ